jgi:predicted HicB family RNase H-like nuclease
MSKKIEKIAVRVSWEEAERLRSEARQKRTTVSELVRQVLTECGQREDVQ